MIIIDFNGVVVGQMLSQKTFDEDMMRHQVLNTLRMYNHKFKKQYGQMVIAIDSKSWRRDYFPQYKHKRRETRDDNAEQYKRMFAFLDVVKEELRAGMPYPIIQVDKAEADDIIATLVHRTQQFGQYEDVMIVSADKDFIQLHEYSNVKQFSPMSKKMVSDPDPKRYIFEHILKGDTSDGIPNILSGDSVFVEGVRQTPLSKKRIDTIWEEGVASLNEEEYRNYTRNNKLISLDAIPTEIAKAIEDEFDSVRNNKVGKMTTMNYLISKKCKLLLECIDEFY